jgi:hypothetical protein
MPRRKSYDSTLPPKRTHRISVRSAAALTRRYRKASPASEKTGFFHAQPVRDLLSQPGVVGFRYYHGLDARGSYRLVLVGVDANGADIVRRARQDAASGAKTKSTPDALVLEDHFPCPPWCPRQGPLNE